MSELSHHAEWLSLIDISGPFLAEPVLKDAFPQGLESLDPTKRTMVRQGYDEWREALDLDDHDLPKVHRAWIDLVLKQGLELDENSNGEVLKSADKLPNAIACELPEYGITLRPDYAVTDRQADSKPLILVAVYCPEIPLNEPLKGDSWAASPAERMVELCRGAGVRLGLLTNGEQWMLVDAPVGAVTSLASWYARLWGQESITLQAFVNLLGIRRFFVDPSQQLPALLDNSLKFQDEVTDALGEQVRRAVEVLIQAFDRADVDRKRELLDGVEPAELYEAGLTVMMKIVFLLSAEERGLLLLGDERYEANYAVSTLRMQLRSESEEILERRWDAWSRLLSIFRAVYGGIDHEAMRLPALGGSLFDPDRFPFLEGRGKGSRWKMDPATPLPIDNRTVLYLLDSVQLFQGRTLSYLALDVEQIGYVYEGLLERTVVRATEATLDLDATKNAKNPWVSLPELDDAVARGREAVEELLEERTGSSVSRIRNDLVKAVDQASADKLLTACHADRSTRDRVKPYFHLLRTDRWGYPLLYPKGTFMVRIGADRRETGTHYTPKSFTEAIVKETLEAVVYVGPAEGLPRENWQLKSPAELLDLKICDPAMGSGAFLVQVCRWLSERLVEAWTQSEHQRKSITSDGEVVDEIGAREPLRKDTEERLIAARRLIAERCLYGVDMNPLAVELAKLSIWLVTLAKGRPFGFLDHNLRCGNSLLGISSLDQLYYLDLKPSKGTAKKLFASKIDQAVSEAIELRSQLRSRSIRDIRDVEVMATLDEKARKTLELPQLIADALVGEVLGESGQEIDSTALSIEAGAAIAGDVGKVEAIARRAKKGLTTALEPGKTARHPFHWPLEYPEVFSRGNGGFDAIVGNPPFLGGKKIAGVLGRPFLNYLISTIGNSVKGSADLIAFFFLRVTELIRQRGCYGLIAVNSISEGGTREVGLDQIRCAGNTIFCAVANQVWPGSANVVTSSVHVFKGKWSGLRILNNSIVDSISSYLTDRENWEPIKLRSNGSIVHQGDVLLGDGFLVKESEAKRLIQSDGKLANVLFPFLRGQQINQIPDHSTRDWVISFWDWDSAKAESYSKSLFEHLRERVIAERKEMKSMGGASGVFWRHLWYRSELYHAIGMGEHFISHPDGWNPKAPKPKENLVFARAATKYPCFTFVPNRYVYSDSVCIVAGKNLSLFACLSSDIHTIWAWEHGSKMKQDLRYTHGDIFETFPFPAGVLENNHAVLSKLGQQLFEKRRDYMVARNKGMTKFYNDFHDVTKQDAEIEQLRELQLRIDEEVLTAYEIVGLQLQYGFHQVAYLPEGKSTRLTLSEGAREELLHRFAMLNKSRSEGRASSNSNTRTQGLGKPSKPDSSSPNDLFAIGGGKT